MLTGALTEIQTSPGARSGFRKKQDVYLQLTVELTDLDTA